MLLNKQSVFDKVCTHLYNQREKAKDTSSPVQVCQYRFEKEDGAVVRCAFGCLIPNDMYDSDMEGQDVEDLFGMFPQLKELFISDNIPFGLLGELQSIHDDYDIEDWSVLLRWVAGRWKLECPSILSSKWIPKQEVTS